jgi:hypothetical protein
LPWRRLRPWRRPRRRDRPPGLDIGQGAFWLQLLDRHAAVTSAVWAPVFAALIVAESCLLGWVAEREIRRTPALVTQLLWLLLIGHAVAALLSVDEVVRSRSPLTAGLRAALAQVAHRSDQRADGSARRRFRLRLAGIAGTGSSLAFERGGRAPLF